MAKKGVGLLLGFTGLAVLFGGAYALTGKKLQSLKFSFPGGAKVLKQNPFWLNLLKTKMEFNLGITNPNKGEVKFQSFIADILFRGKVIAQVKVQPQAGLTLPGQKTIILRDIRAKLDNLQAASVFFSFIKNGGLKDKVSIVGKIQADGFTYPINEEINFQA